jgi:glycosyltransferase 2 family protein
MTPRKSNANLKRGLLVGIGMLIGAICLYIAFRDISWADFMVGLKEMKPVYFLPAALLYVLIQIVRALRFGVIISPFCSLTKRELWDLTNIWGALNVMLPARLGELVRPYLLKRRGVPFSSSFGAVMVERFFDLSGLLALLAFVMWTTPEIPKEFSVLGQIMLAGLAVGYAIVLIILTRRDTFQSFVDKLLSWLPSKASGFLGDICQRLVDGLGIMASPRQAIVVFMCSIGIWLLFSVITYLFLLAFSLELPFLVAVTVQVIICVSVALPSAPGFIGTFHAAGRYSLALFGINATTAVLFTTVYHLFSTMFCILVGAISYWTGDFRLDRELIYTEVEDEITPDEPLVPSKSPG